MVEGVVPELAEILNQFALDDAVQFREEPPPVLEIDIVWLGGLAEPTEAVKVRLDGLAVNDGGSDDAEL
jgi:hypothetical protein